MKTSKSSVVKLFFIKKIMKNMINSVLKMFYPMTGKIIWIFLFLTYLGSIWSGRRHICDKNPRLFLRLIARFLVLSFIGFRNANETVYFAVDAKNATNRCRLILIVKKLISRRKLANKTYCSKISEIHDFFVADMNGFCTISMI